MTILLRNETELALAAVVGKISKGLSTEYGDNVWWSNGHSFKNTVAADDKGSQGQRWLRYRLDECVKSQFEQGDLFCPKQTDATSPMSFLDHSIESSLRTRTWATCL